MRKNTSAPPTTTKRPVLILIGPTAAGKTACALELAEACKGEIISADSMQVYRHMDIGTAKPTPEERSRVPHHLIDIVDPDEEWTVAEFTRRASHEISAVHSRGRLPIVCGGTGLYIRSLIGGYNFPPRDPSGGIRAALQHEADEGADLFARLAVVDPVSARRIEHNDIRRIIRALEVYELTGRTISSFETSPTLPDSIHIVGIHRERADLYRRINERVTRMIRDGLIEEVRGLLNKGYSNNLRSMQALGYKETIRFLEGHGTPIALEAEIQKQTRNFAKRQMTWWRSFNGIHWYAPDENGESFAPIVDFYCNKLAS